MKKRMAIAMARRGLCILSSAFMLLTLSLPVLAEGSPDDADAASAADTTGGDTAMVSDTSTELPTYQDYNAQWENEAAGSGSVTIPAAAAVDSALPVQTYAGKDGVVMLDEDGGKLTYRFTVETSGRYTLGALYYPLAADSTLDTNLSFKVDGEIPFEEAETVYLSKVYVNESEIQQDAVGNDLRPTQVEQPEWMETKFIDNSGYNPDAFELYLTAGEHTLTVNITQNSIALAALTVEAAEALPTYAEKLAEYADAGYTQVTDYLQEIQAEGADKKSSSEIYPDNSRASAATLPSDPSCLKLNIISSSEDGDWISWTVTVPESGLYQLGFRVLQDWNRGMVSTRRLYIDGEVPFDEANTVEFPYSPRWYNFVAGGSDSPWLFYLAAGEHTIKLECTTGRFASTLSVIKNAVYDLNTLCRKITMVTGISPDTYRDYDFDSEIPDLKEQLTTLRDTLSNELDRLNGEMDYEGSELVTVEDIIRQINSFIENPDTIASRLSNFRTNISTLGSWLLDMTNQGLTMDTVVLFSSDKSMRKANADMLQQLSYDMQAVIGTFLIDYNSIGTTGEADAGQITVWVATGRDQANIIRRMIDDDFTSETNIAVHLSLVGDSTTLLQATLAGEGPDAALFVEKTLPVNLAARGALVDLSTFDGFEEITERFSASAMIPYSFNGGTYALPNSQGFNVMFIRTDIFKELGIEIPDTWDEFYKVLPVIQRNNMEVGVGGDAQYMFETLIMQNGGQFYNDDLTATAFNTSDVLTAFQMWTGFYTDYSLPLTYDAFTYFRSGIMPLLIADYTVYNQLAVAAPEIKGVWTIVPIPGTAQADGTINRTESATGTASILMSSAKDKESAFAFLDWWTSTGAQKRYSLELEATMGPAARYNSANQEAIGYLAWKDTEYAAITKQWESVWDISSIPSSYYVTRNVSNAFRSVVYNGTNERETLNKYGNIINKEIIRKNKELGLD